MKGEFLENSPDFPMKSVRDDLYERLITRKWRMIDIGLFSKPKNQENFNETPDRREISDLKLRDFHRLRTAYQNQIPNPQQ